MEEQKEFTIRDRRAAASKADDKPSSGSPDASSKGTSETRRKDAPQDAGDDDTMDFSTFIVSLASSTQVSLGAIPHPETNQLAQNFPAAKQMIDILGMLQEKTKGNLTEAEAALLEQVLFNLRMHYVRVVNEKK